MSYDLTPEFRRALDLLEKGKQNLFITGRAGTGKSTLLQQFRSTTSKSAVVLAPTGVAAVNVGGETIHSFFGFKPNVTPEGVRKLRGQRAKLYKTIETIIIDEISMVRADLLDAVAQFLFLNGRNPGELFGGVQMVFFGDLYQLPPIVQRKEEEAFRHHYETPYFFSAKSFPALLLEWIELTKVFRQTDTEFLTILNHIRNQTVSEMELSLLNRQVVRANNHSPLPDDFIVLTTTNKQALTINLHRLARLPAKTVSFAALIEGTFEENAHPTALQLELKEGAQVMLLNNDSLGRWVNGTIGKIKKIDMEEERLMITLPNQREEEITPYTWDMFHFSVDPTLNRLVPVSIGKFTQMPVRLAWAITIHKSQGLTFDKAVIDLTDGTFVHGQLYVAISRLRTLSGLLLTCPVKKGDILLDYRILKFITAYQRQLSEIKLPIERKIELIDEAIRKKRVIKMVYLKNSDEKTDRIVTPISVGDKTFQGLSYVGLVAYCHRREEERTFRVDRILEMEVKEGVD
ncbi:MAG: AAA family ATPase [Nitrospirae bacterium]|nr:AAA family ATPase [Candidatus Troglogloeales bacterium]